MKDSIFLNKGNKIPVVFLSVLFAFLLPLNAFGLEELDFEQNGIGENHEEQSQTEESEETSDDYFARDQWVCTQIGPFLKALLKKGLCLGFTYEHDITDYAGLKGGLAWSIYNPENPVFANSVCMITEASWYPLGEGLDKLHFGAGLDADCLFYSEGSSYLGNDWVITAYPFVGWKQDVFNLFALDFYTGYKFTLNGPDERTQAYRLYENGLMLNVSITFNWMLYMDFLKNLSQKRRSQTN